MAFDDQAYVDAYNQRGELPGIHKDIRETIERHLPTSRNCAFDFGSCTGLLSVFLARHFQQVVGFEGHKPSLKRAVAHERVEYVSGLLRPYAPVPEDWLRSFKPSLVVMRRVLPEISSGDPATAKAFIAMLAEYEVNTLVLEGRVDSPRSTHPLRNIAFEIECCSPNYELVSMNHRCAVLRQ